MKYVKVRAHGKINLALDVIRKREDGYHDVRMIMQSVGIYDRVEIEFLGKSDNGSYQIEIETNLRFLPVNENNLAYKAAALLMEEFKLNYHILIRIKKMIPVAAGMAGGSSDCAAVMKGINKMFNLGLNEEELKKRGVKLGADIPYCIMGGTALSEGIGEILTPLKPMPECYIVLAKPYINVSTKFVYGNLKATELKSHPDIDGMIEAINKNDFYGMAKRLGNVLETVTEKEYPIITQIKERMIELGAVNSIMSGSGPTVFGLFDDVEKAKYTYEVLKGSEDCRQVYITDGGNGDERY
ncbi:MAG: 4-(cytidine 5'-diphospho)-2-C-methyl-D-erythritol kinase [Lachnospiraceae bacterium]|nr:4-(cytidine 5'-diphospho)-2-C-methyl-D-erythritol kinase [Lachnospiraceae bacterium]